MSFDSTCKFIAEHFPQDIATWLLGKTVTLTKLESSELSVEPIRADSVIFLQSDHEILHAEFQVDPKDNVPFSIKRESGATRRRSPRRTA
jgi:predicted transposase YdaD